MSDNFLNTLYSLIQCSLIQGFSQRFPTMNLSIPLNIICDIFSAGASPCFIKMKGPDLPTLIMCQVFKKNF